MSASAPQIKDRKIIDKEACLLDRDNNDPHINSQNSIYEQRDEFIHNDRNAAGWSIFERVAFYVEQVRKHI